ncbi:outer membrane biogenesis protein BamB [Gimesia panareensis]|uniref:Outer membrane biogenesis protein BamB n=1 Tax=Gimesia panareensis TaxID=2527978 RepID=A0A517Q0V9_9PLAN|nr:PQQ-binding-like beta-propeller repeat protein [Gimesia panareensis]QDT25277.1 outer membrane biogenesis protein BamB [Gimesia panareensis]
MLLAFDLTTLIPERSRYPLCGWLLILCLLQPGLAFGQVDQGAGLNGAAPFELFPASRQYSKRYQDARQLIEEKNYSAGIPELQAILDAPEDFVTNERGAGFHSLKRAAEDLLSKLPADGKKYYSVQYGPTAEQMLREAVEQDKLDLLREVVRRFFYTNAGAEAAYTLAAWYYERGDLPAAAQLWEMLSERHDQATKKEPHLTFKLAVTWYHLGNLGKCRQALMKLAREVNGPEYVFPNGKKVTLFQEGQNPVEWLSQLVGTPDLQGAREQSDWNLYRGNADRTASAEFAVPSSKPVWQFSTIRDPFVQGNPGAPPLEAILQKLGEYRRKHLSGVLPAASPIVAGETVVVRTHRNLKGLDLQTGKLKWETTVSDALFREMLKDPQNSDEEFLGTPQTPLQKYLTQRAWQDYTVGHLSSDGKLVFSVENVGFIGGFYHFSREDRESVLSPNSYNRLMAFEVETGKFVWELGGPRLQNPINYSGHYFLGPPLPLDGKLYCLAEEGREFRLLVLDAQTGKTLWTQSLFRSEYPIARDYTTDRRPLDHIRRRMGLSPSLAHGVLVCPTGSGCTVGINAVSRQLLWRNVEQHRNAITSYAAFSRDANANAEGWAEFTPLIVGNRVLLQSRSGQDLKCLDLFDGRLIWSRPRRNNLFIASVQDDRILLVGPDRMEALKLSDGAPAWPKSQKIPAPSGRGIVVRNTYYQPVDTGEILSIRLEDGLILARTRVDTDTLVGNLSAGSGMLVAQNEMEVIGFRSVESIVKQIQLASLSNEPAEQALAELLRGELYLYSGNVKQALQKIERSIEIKPTIRARRLYADMMLESLDHDFNLHQNQISKIEPLLVDENQQRRFFQILAMNYQSQGNLKAALENYLKLSELKSLFSTETAKGGAFVRTDRWIRSQLELLMVRATEPQRAEIDDFFAGYYADHLVSAGTEELQRFLKCCGNLAATQQTRILLVERLEQSLKTAAAGKQSALRRELMQQLEQLRQASLPVGAAFATAKLAEIYLSLNRYSQAALLLKELETSWPDVICLNGKTGRQLAQAWQSDPAFQKQLQPKSAWPAYPAQVYRDEQSKGQNTSLPVEIIGLTNPLFENQRLEVGPAKEQLLAFDSAGKPLWTFSLAEAGIEVPQQPYFSARVFENYLIVNFGAEFFVLDPLNRNVDGQPTLLWKQRMIPGPPSLRDYISIERTGLAPVLREYITRNSDREQLGRIGTVNEEFLCYQLGGDLIAADLLTGEILWKRQGLATSSWHFGDAEHVIVMTSENRTEPRYVVLSGSDGEVVNAFKLKPGDSAVFAFERFLLTLGPPADATRRMELRDLVSDEVVWSMEIDKETNYTLGQNYEIAMIAPEGTISIVDLRTGEKKTEVKGQAAPNVLRVLLLENEKQYLVFVSLPYVAKSRVTFRPMSMTTLMFNGMLYSIDRETGELMWSRMLEAQGVDFTQFFDLPVMTFGIRRVTGGPVTSGNQVDLEVIDLRDGSQVLKETTSSNRLRIWVVPDLARKNILIEPFQIRLSFEEPPVTAKKPETVSE